MQDRGFFGRLFDLSFSEFITTSVVRFLYVLLLIVIAIGYLVAIITGFANSFGRGLLMIVVGAVGALLYILFARIWMEILIVVFRIAENTQELAEQGRRRE